MGAVMHRDTDHLGRSRKEEIRSNCNCWIEVEQKHKQRGHKRPATNARQAHQGANKNTCNNVTKRHTAGEYRGAAL
jgi:hypothetical protein